jgi:hypothetical protein
MATLKQVITSTAALQGKSYPEIAAWLGGADPVENPVTVAPMVPASVTLKAIMGLVPAVEMAKVYRLPGFITDLRTAIDGNDHEYMGVLMQIALADGAITAATAAKLQPMLLAQVADPSWSAQIPGPARWQTLGLAGAPSAADVQAAVHSTGV